jgi:PAS domain S-box-containing protein
MTGPANARRGSLVVPAKPRTARSEVSRALRFRVMATGLGALGGALAAIAFFAARDPFVARVAGASNGVPALVVLLAFTAIAIIVVVHYGRRTADLTVAYHDLHRATLQRERSEAALRESERFVRATLDAMEAMIAVLDADGVVMAVNRAWRQGMDDFVGRDGGCDVGANYVTLCESVQDERAPIAHQVAAGLREVLAGTRDGFTLESPSGVDERRLLSHVTRFPGHGLLRLVVAHQYVTLAEPAHHERDLPEAHQADEAIRVLSLATAPPDAGSEARFQTLADAAPVGAFLVDAEGRNVYTNPKWHEITGVAPEHRTTWADAIHPDDRDRVMDRWLVLLRRPDAFHAEFRLGTTADDVRWVHVLAAPLPQGGGFVGAMLDVTQRRASEERMRVLAADLGRRVEDCTRERDRLFTLSRDLLCVANGTHFTTVNPAFTAVLGYTTDELLARPYLELVHPEDRDVTRAQTDRLAAGEPVVQLENRYRHRDGSWRRIAWTAVPEPPDLVYATGRDLTERERARYELERMAGELRDLYDTAPCGHHTLDAAGIFLAVNEIELGWLGRRREELIGRRRFADLLSDGGRRRFDEACEGLETDDRPIDVELDVVREGGALLPVRLRATAVRDGDGRFLGSRASLLDVAERRRAAERIAALDGALAARADELEKANRALEWFSSSVAHDLRAPLREIDEVARMLHVEHGEELGAGGKRHLGIIRENAGRMTRVMDALVDLSRIDSDPLEPSCVDMTALANAAVDDARRGTPEREVTVDVGALAPVVGDLDLLRQVFANLIANAFKYTAKVAHPCVDVGSVDHDGATVYYVRDNGAGFDMRHAGKLFQVFQRLHAADEFDGTGIGLALVQRVVERHGGHAWAEGRVGEGATFFFTLGDRPSVEGDAAPSA